MYDTRASFSVRSVLQGACACVHIPLLCAPPQSIPTTTNPSIAHTPSTPNQTQTGHARPCFGAQVVPRSVAKRHFRRPPPPSSSSSLGAAGGAAAATAPETETETEAEADAAPADERPPFLLMTWSSDSTLALHDLSAPAQEPLGVAAAAPFPVPQPPLLVTPHADFPILCASFSPEVEGVADWPVRLVLGGGEGLKEERQFGGKACSGLGHDFNHQTRSLSSCNRLDEDETGPRTLLCYAFA